LLIRSQELYSKLKCGQSGIRTVLARQESEAEVQRKRAGLYPDGLSVASNTVSVEVRELIVNRTLALESFKKTM